MKVFAICYDLKTPGRNYAPLYAEIKKASKWWHYLDSTWLVHTAETPEQIWNRLGKLIDQNDSMLIIEVRNSKKGWLPKGAWDWMNANVPPP